MKKWKQILALTLAVVVTLSVVPVGDARAAVEEPTEYAIVGEIINADGAEITVKEISKDGTENVELPWEELEEDTQNSDTEKDTKIFYTDELEAGKDYLIEVQPKEDYKIVLESTDKPGVPLLEKELKVEAEVDEINLELNILGNDLEKLKYELNEY